MVALPCVTGAGPTVGFCKSQLHDQQRVRACTESSVRTEDGWEGKVRTHLTTGGISLLISSFPATTMNTSRALNSKSTEDHALGFLLTHSFPEMAQMQVGQDSLGSLPHTVSFAGTHCTDTGLLGFPWNIKRGSHFTYNISHTTKGHFAFPATASLGEPLSARMAAFLPTTIQDGKGRISIAPTHPSTHQGQLPLPRPTVLLFSFVHL